MIEAIICEPMSDYEFMALAHIREIAAVKAYSNPQGPSELDVMKHYSDESDTIIDKIQNKEFSARIVRLGRDVVAMCVWSVSEVKARIEYLYTHPDHQGRGYGSALLNNAISELGDSEVELTTQSAQVFYEKWGFRRTGIYVIDPITSEEIMIKKH